MDKNIVKACAGIVGAKISVEPYASAATFGKRLCCKGRK
jgi:hypothetical protein